MSSFEQLSGDDANSADGEGVWSPEIEFSFQEALKLFPPCGRRKHILQEEGGGKMYGRNELIARHILMKTGKRRTRKQVSSHIQVLNRRKHKLDIHSTSASTSSGATPSPSSAGSLSMSFSGASSLSGGYQQQQYNTNNNHQVVALNQQLLSHNNQIIKRHEPDTLQITNRQLIAGSFYDAWSERPIVTSKIRLVEFSAFIEHRNLIHHHNQHANANDNHQPANQQHSQESQIFPAPNNHLRFPVPQFNQTYGTQQALSMIKSEPHANTQQQALQSATGTTIAQQHSENNNLVHNFNNHQILSNDKLQHQQSSSSSGYTRHCYVKIDYSQPICRQTNKLERIDITQIQDKFPTMSGPNGLFQRASPDSFYLVKFWADINDNFEYNIDDQNSYFGFSSHFETIEPYKDLTCSTKACSFGGQVVEKVDKICATFNTSTGRYSYDMKRSPMCEFMIQFIKQLRQLPRVEQMNNVLENFSILQVITSEVTSEVLLCLAYVFEVASTEQNNRPQYHVYKLTRD